MAIEGLKPLALLGGYDAAELWPTVHLALPSWLLLILAPRWKHTPALSLVGPVLHAAIYALSMISLTLLNDGGGAEDVDFFTLEGVAAIFRDPSGVFVGWIHYCAYDVLVGRWIALDAVGRGCSLRVHVLALVPCLFLAMMAGPMGWLLYISVVRTLLLPQRGDGGGYDKANKGS
ncbi:hypothetical protein ACHAWF_006296 [Thalassiosira exigua]